MKIAITERIISLEKINSVFEKAEERTKACEDKTVEISQFEKEKRRI